MLLKNVAPPALPNPPGEYSRGYLETLNNVLRLYFSQLSQLLSNLFGTGGGGNLSFPYGAFHQDGVTTLSAGITNNSTTPIPVVSTTGFAPSGYILVGNELIGYTAITATTFAGTITRGALGSGSQQSAHSAGTYVSEVQGTGSGTAIGIVRFNFTDYSNGIGINPADPTQMVFSTTGIYNIQMSYQLANYGNSADNITTWLRKNGADVANTTSIMAVPAAHSTTAGATILAYNVFINMSVNDYLQIGWTTDSGNSVIITYPPGVTPTHPASPAAIVTASFVSAV